MSTQHAGRVFILILLSNIWLPLTLMVNKSESALFSTISFKCPLTEETLSLETRWTATYRIQVLLPIPYWDIHLAKLKKKKKRTQNIRSAGFQGKLKKKKKHPICLHHVRFKNVHSKINDQKMYTIIFFIKERVATIKKATDHSTYTWSNGWVHC